MIIILFNVQTIRECKWPHLKVVCMYWVRPHKKKKRCLFFFRAASRSIQQWAKPSEAL